ncbi:hypothetical protein V8F20_004986, partial [Naviculisporaceae sp. PSN 640]
PFIIWEEKGLHRHYCPRGGGLLPTRDTSGGGVHRGGFGDVWKAAIDPKDGRFSHTQNQSQHMHGGGYFAIKLFRQNGEALTSTNGLGLEVRSLIFAKGRPSGIPEAGDTGTKHHLVQLLATFESSVPPGGANPSLVVHLGRKKLEDLGDQKHRGMNLNDEILLSCMVDQFCHLAKALQCVHNDCQQIAINTGTDGHRYGRHGDITPKNFLLFRNALDKRKHRLGLRIVMADFGLGRLHSEASRSKDDPRNMPNTASYAAPEYEGPADIFSLGCVFLMHIVWLFDGVDNGLNQFAQERKNERDVRYGDNWELDNFWHTTMAEPSTVKTSVKRKFVDLKDRNNCVEMVGDILTVIEDGMRRVDQNDRFGAERLVLELTKIRNKLKHGNSGYGSRAWKDRKKHHYRNVLGHKGAAGEVSGMGQGQW